MTTAPPRRTARTLLIWLVLAALLPGMFGAAILFLHQYQEGRAVQDADTLQTARALTQAIDLHLLRSQAAGEAMATAQSLVARDFRTFHQRAQQLVNNGAGVADNLVLRGRDEQLVLNALLPYGQPLPQQPSREHVRHVFSTGKPAISNLYRVPQFAHPIISVDVPVMIDTEVAFSLGITVSPLRLNATLTAQSLPRGWVATVYDPTGTVAARNISPETFVGRKAPERILQALSKAPEGNIDATTLEGIPVKFSYSRSPATGWAVGIGIPREELQRALLLSLSRLALSIAALFAVGLILAWYMGGRIARSVSALTAPAVALGRGERVQIPQLPMQEAAEVGAALNHASELLHEREAAVRAREADLEEAHARLRGIIDSSPALIYLKDLNGNLLLVNKAYETLIGVDPAKVRVTTDRYAPLPHDHGPSAADLEVLKSGETVQFEEEVSTAQGIKYFAVSKGPLRNPAGEVIGVCAAAVDVTPLKAAEAEVRGLLATLEARVAQRTEALRVANAALHDVNDQLKSANEQLEAFSHTVAHDLRAPLRGIRGFADALLEDYKVRLDETGQDYLLRVSRAAGRMEQLIEDLLSFSRLSRRELVLEKVFLPKVMQDVLASLEANIQEREPELAIEPDLPQVYANRTACFHIFHNLISNALKFTRPDTRVSIRIWAQPRPIEQQGPRLVRIWVEDNGIGVPEAHQQRIFKPFERLHGMSEYLGSGIGLAIVDTTVRRMQGRCGVESNPRGGSRFWVDLPVIGEDDA